METQTVQTKQYLIFREVPVTDSRGFLLGYNHLYLGPFAETEIEDKYKQYLKARIPHESVIQIEIGKPYPVKSLEEPA